MSSSNVTIDSLLLLSLLVVLMFPLFPVYFGNNSFHVIPLAVILSLTLLFRKNNNCFFIEKTHFGKITVFFSVTFLLMYLALINDSFYQKTELSSFVGLLKPVYFFLFFLIGYSNKINEYKIVNTICLFFEIAIFLSFSLAIIELFFIDEFSDLLYVLYKRQERIVLLDKATGWFGVTYYFAYFTSLLCFFSFFMLSKVKSFKYLIITLLSLSTIFLTQSRTVIISFAFGFMVIPFLKVSRSNKNIYFIYLLFLGFIISLFIAYFDFITDNFRYAYAGIKRVTEGIDLYGEGSVQTRFKQFLWAWNQNKYKLIGFGLGRGEGVALESIYASYLYRFGLFYLVFYIFMIYHFYKISSKLAILFKNDNLLYSFFSGCSLFYLTSPISLLASPSHEMPKIAFVVFIISGVVYRYNIKYLYLKKNDTA